jgi:hypothetical protein
MELTSKSLTETIKTEDSLKSYYPKEYDQSIIGICDLFDAESINKEVFKDYERFLYQADELFIVSNTSYCRLHIANGGKKGEFQSVTVGRLSTLLNEIKYKGIEYKEDFKTNNSISLGMSLEDFYKTIPKNIKLSKSIKEKSVLIKVNDTFNSYSADYTFLEGHLVEFSFGYSED